MANAPKVTLATLLLASTAFLAPIPAVAFDASIDAMLQSWKNEDEVIGNADGPSIPSTETPDATQRFNDRLQGIATARTSSRGSALRPTTSAGRTQSGPPQTGERRTITVGELTVDRELAPKLDMDAAAEGIVALREPSGGTTSTGSSTSRSTTHTSSRTSTASKTTGSSRPSAVPEQDDEEVGEDPSSTEVVLYDETGAPMGSIGAEGAEVSGTDTPNTTPVQSPRPARASTTSRATSPAPTQTTGSGSGARPSTTSRSTAQASSSRTSGTTQKVKLYDEDGNPIVELSLSIPESKNGAPPSQGTRRSVASRPPSGEESEDLAY
jgi:hypothetical protein